jgi:PAS domain S-box
MQIPSRFLGKSIGSYIKLARNLFEAAYIVDQDGTVLYWNQAAYDLTGYDYQAMIGKKCRENSLMHFDEKGRICCQTSCPVQKAIDLMDVYAGEFSIHHKSGYIIPVDIRCLPLFDGENQIIGVLEIFRRKQDPIKALKTSVVHGLVQTAYIDTVTNLPNRQYMEQKIKTLLLDSITSSRELLLSLLIIDVRNLADFNSYGGLPLGNLLLQIVGKTLFENVELEEGSFVSRWYGGSFIVFINTNKKPILLNWANKLKFALDHTTVPGWEDISIEISVYGTIVENGETFGEITTRLERQWSVCKESPKGISIS